MKKILLTVSFIYSSLMVGAQEDGVPIFISGNDGFKSFRIPAIIQTPQGVLLAFCEGRVNGGSDFGDINIVMRKSMDGGKTWDSIHTLVDFDKLQAGNPAPVVDLTDPAFPQGRIFLFYNTGNNHEGEVRKGNGLREVWYITSIDGGYTWSSPVNITTQTHRPKQPAINAGYDFSEDWRSYANTPGHAMQFQTGTYRGRIYVSANHSSGTPKPHFEDYNAHGFFTDDHGKTFRLSENIYFPGSNEAIAAELSGGRLMMNIRNQRGDVKARIIGISNSGGEKWDEVYFDRNLPDPVCQGTLLDIGKKKGHNIMAFCNAADTSARNNLTLRISFDDGKTWEKSFVVKKEPGSKSPSAYSDIVKLDSRNIGVLYEKDNYSQIFFTIVKWK